MTDSIKNEKKYKQIIIALLAIILLLIIWILVEKNRVHTIYLEKDTAVNKSIELQMELDSLMREHSNIKNEYSSLTYKLAEKDSIILANAGEIQKLIANQGDYNKTKKKLELLRKITQGYVSQLDSLYKVNQELTNENIKIKKEIGKERMINNELTKEKETLNEKVNVGSMLKAYNIKPFTVKLRSSGSKEIETDKAKRIERVNICFTLSENKIAQSGRKIIYIRIARPDNVIVCEGKEDIYSFEYQGQKLQYSMKKEIDYDNKAMDVCLSWNKRDPKTPALVGIYHVAIFVDGYEIGQTKFELK